MDLILFNIYTPSFMPDSSLLFKIYLCRVVSKILSAPSYLITTRSQLDGPIKMHARLSLNEHSAGTFSSDVISLHAQFHSVNN